MFQCLGIFRILLHEIFEMGIYIEEKHFRKQWLLTFFNYSVSFVLTFIVLVCVHWYWSEHGLGIKPQYFLSADPNMFILRSTKTAIIGKQNTQSNSYSASSCYTDLSDNVSWCNYVFYFGKVLVTTT